MRARTKDGLVGTALAAGMLVFTIATALLIGCGSRSDLDDPVPPDSVEDVLLEVIDGVPVYGDPRQGLVSRDGAWDADEMAAESDIGTAEQELVAAPSGSGNTARHPGFQPGSEIGCTVGAAAGTNCVVPPVNGLTKQFRFYLLDGFSGRIGAPPGDGGTAAQHVRTELNAWYQEMVTKGAESSGAGALQFSESFDIGDDDLTYVIQVHDTGNSCSGTNSKGVVCFTGSTTSISVDSTLPDRIYHRMVDVPVIHIDYNDIRNRAGWTHTNKIRAVRQAVYLGALKGIGQGPVPHIATLQCDETAVTAGFACKIETVHACRLNGYGDYGDPWNLRLGGANCGS